MEKARIVSLDEEWLEKARTAGAKDKRPRKKAPKGWSEGEWEDAQLDMKLRSIAKKRGSKRFTYK
jgi:hypothetical protein